MFIYPSWTVNNTAYLIKEDHFASTIELQSMAMTPPIATSDNYFTMFL